METKNLDIYGDPPIPWSRALAALDADAAKPSTSPDDPPTTYWLGTTRPDGRPHSIPVWGFWVDGDLCFGTARSSRKAQNLAQNAAVSIHLDSGDDTVLAEGESANPVVARGT